MFFFFACGTHRSWPFHFDFHIHFHSNSRFHFMPFSNGQHRRLAILTTSHYYCLGHLSFCSQVAKRKSFALTILKRHLFHNSISNSNSNLYFGLWKFGGGMALILRTHIYIYKYTLRRRVHSCVIVSE